MSRPVPQSTRSSSAPPLPRVDQVAAAATEEPVGVAPADQLVGTAKAPERVVLGGTDQPVRSGVANSSPRGRPGERHHHQPHNRQQDGHLPRHSLTSFVSTSLYEANDGLSGGPAIASIRDLCLCTFCIDTWCGGLRGGPGFFGDFVVGGYFLGGGRVGELFGGRVSVKAGGEHDPTCC